MYSINNKYFFPVYRHTSHNDQSRIQNYSFVSIVCEGYKLHSTKYHNTTKHNENIYNMTRNNA